MTDVEIGGMKLGDFDRLQRLLISRGKNAAMKVLHKEAVDMKADMRSRILDSKKSWGKKVNDEKATNSLADAIIIETEEDSVHVKFKDGTHTETGKSFQEAAAKRDKAAPFFDKAINKVTARGDKIGETIVEKQEKIIKAGIGK